jgi:hypothetical protein
MTSMLLRYNKDLQYIDFSDDETVVNKIRRAELYGTWKDIEDVTKAQDSFHNEFEEQKDLT